RKRTANCEKVPTVKPSSRCPPRKARPDRAGRSESSVLFRVRGIERCRSPSHGRQHLRSTEPLGRPRGGLLQCAIPRCVESCAVGARLTGDTTFAAPNRLVARGAGSYSVLFQGAWNFAL